MKYTLIIDYREHALKNYFDDFDFKSNKNLKHVEYKIENLDLGDIIIKRDEEIILIIERKTLQDLYSSINDGRYKEQKVRLKNNFSDSQIVYIIENCDVKFIKKKFSNFDSIINGAIINSIFRDNINLLRTNSVDETITYIKTLLKKVKNNIELFVKPTPLVNNSINMHNQTTTNNSLEVESSNTPSDNDNVKIIELKTNNSSDYVDNIKIKKKDNNNPENCNIIMLCQIPGVSTKISKTICDKYNSISNLVNEYNNNYTQKEKEYLLKDLTFPINNDKIRKIGPVISKRVYQYLFSIN
jgi:crossover junction endonuclease MUS81